MHILLIEDNRDLAEFIKDILKSEKHKVTVKHSVLDVMKNFSKFDYDFLILDLLLQNERGEDLLVKLRRNEVDIPIIVLSAICEDLCKVNLLKMGADDYMTKPFNFRELIARIEALSRRSSRSGRTEKQIIDDYIFYWDQNKFIFNKREFYLTEKEARFIKLLAENLNRIVKNEEILRGPRS